MKNIIICYLIVFSQFTIAEQTMVPTANDILKYRTQLINKVFNAEPEKLTEPIEDSNIELGRFDGRVIINKKSKLTYYVHIEEADNTFSKMTLIPMSTSRFTPTYYQTDDWWDAHKTEIEQAKKNGTPAPRQDIEEVSDWLEKMKLSTNPEIIEINSSGKVKRQGLNEFLLDIYLNNFVENGNIILYRGAEKPNEIDSWKKGELPRGARYWTPTANYAWRYARKNTEFLNLLIRNETPLFRFEIPLEQFKEMIQRRWRWLTLGTELTKNSHLIFDNSRYFGDHLYSNMPFLGVGFFGVEFELRANRTGAQEMVKFYKRPATIDDLANDRIKVLKQAMQRLQKQLSFEYEEKYKSAFEARIKTVETELATIKAIQERQTEENIKNKMNSGSTDKGEISNIDGSVRFSSWVQKNLKQFSKLKCEALF